MLPVMMNEMNTIAIHLLWSRFGCSSNSRLSMALYITSSQPSVVIISKRTGIAARMSSKFLSEFFHSPPKSRQSCFVSTKGSNSFSRSWLWN